MNPTPKQESERPLKRCLHEAVWSERSGRMLLYGGCSSGFGPCPQGDLWAFNPVKSGWSQIKLKPAPLARSNPGMVHDPGRNQILLFGGLTEAGYDRALWSLSGVGGDHPEWTEITASGDTPPASRQSRCRDHRTAPLRLWRYGRYRGTQRPLDHQRAHAARAMIGAYMVATMEPCAAGE